MAKSKKGLRIGNYRITPLGIGTLVAILLIIVAIVVLLVLNPFGEDGLKLFSQPTPTPEPTATVAPTPVPTPTPTPEPTPRAVTVRSLGEIAIQKNLLAAAKQDDGSYDFSEMFTSYFGQTFSSKLNDLKTNYAKVLLKSGFSVTETCFRSGFRSMSSFLTVFKEKTGIPPKKYKEINMPKS